MVANIRCLLHRCSPGGAKADKCRCLTCRHTVTHYSWALAVIFLFIGRSLHYVTTASFHILPHSSPTIIQPPTLCTVSLPVSLNNSQTSDPQRDVGPTPTIDELAHHVLCSEQCTYCCVFRRQCFSTFFTKLPNTLCGDHAHAPPSVT